MTTATITAPVADPLDSVEVTTENGTVYKVAQLRAAFEAIQPKTDWRAEIAGEVKAADFGLVAAAVEFFTATKLTVHGCVIHDEIPYLRIFSIGYRRGPAGP